MTTDTIRLFLAAGIFMLLVMLRLDAERFGTAEYDEPGARKGRGVATWLSWYVLGGAFLYAIYVVHPRPHDQLYLLIGHLADVVVWGGLLAIVGAAAAVLYAEYRYGAMRLPPLGSYPRAAVDAIGTAVIDESTFRGVVLGSIVTLGTPYTLAIAASTLLYLLVGRFAAPGRPRYMLIPATGYGVLGGVATLVTGGVGAAIVGHAVTRFSFFVATGHPGHTEPIGRELEEVAAARVPAGWHDARDPQIGGGGAEPLGLEQLGAGRPQQAPGTVAAARRRLAEWRHSIGRQGSRGVPDGRRH